MLLACRKGRGAAPSALYEEVNSSDEKSRMDFLHNPIMGKQGVRHQ